MIKEKRLHIYVELSKNSAGCTIELRNLFWDTEIAGRSDVPIQYYYFQCFCLVPRNFPQM